MSKWPSVIFILLSSTFLFGQSQLSIPDMNAPPGTQVAVPVTISEGAGITALQFKLLYDPVLLEIGGEGGILRGGALTDHTLGSHREGGQLSFIIFSGSLKPLKTGPGTLFQLVIHVNSEALADSATSLSLLKVQASDAQGNAIDVAGQDGSITFSSTANVPLEGENQLLFPQFANGQFQGGTFGVLLVLVNRTGAAASGRVDFVKSTGESFVVTLEDGRTDSQFAFEIPAGGSVFMATDGLGPLNTGYAKISATAPIGGTLLFKMGDPGGKTLTEAGVGSSLASREFSIPVLYEAPGSDTGIAFANPFDEDVELVLILKDISGSTVGEPQTVELPARQHKPQFATQFFPILKERDSFQGSIEVQASADVSVIALKQEGLLLTTFPAVIMERGGSIERIEN